MARLLGRRAGSGIPASAGRRDFVLLLFSTGTLQASRLGLNLVAASILPVAAFGTWGLIQALLLYTTYTNLGTLNGANRSIPIHLGRGDADAAQRDERTALAGSLLAGGVAGVAFGGMVWVWTADVALAFAVGILIGCQQPYLFYQVALRSRMQFDRASVQQLALGLGLPLMGLPLLVAYGLTGLALAFGTVYLAGAVMPWFTWRRGVTPDLDLRRLAALMRSGIPIMVIGLLFGVMISLDRWVILAVLGDQALGVYTLAATLTGGLQLVFVVLAQQFYPRVAGQYGRDGNSPALFAAALRISALSSAAVLPFALVLAGLGPILIVGFQAYAGVGAVLPVLAAGSVVLAFSNGFTNLLVAMGRYPVLFAVHLVAIGVGGAAAFAAAREGLGIVGVASGMVAGFGALALGSAIVAWRATHE